MRTIRRLLRRTEGQDLIEYALLASLISLVVVVALSSVGLSVSGSFGKVGTALSGAGAPGGGNGNNGNGNGNNGNGNGNGNNGNGNNGNGNSGGNKG